MGEAQKKVFKMCEAKILGYVINLPYASVFQFARPRILFLMLLSGSLANSNIRNKNILISHKHKLIP